MVLWFRPLRNFLISHLKHSNFTSESDTSSFELMQYIDKHYSNPSFIVEYNLKSTKILMSKEFKLLSYDNSVTLINNKYNINKEKFEELLNKDEYMQDKLDKDRAYFSKNMINSKKGKDLKLKDFYQWTYDGKSNLYFHREPMLNDINISTLDEILNKNYFKLTTTLPSKLSGLGINFCFLQSPTKSISSKGI